MTTASTLSGSVHVWRFLLTISANMSLMNQSVKRTKRPQVMCLCLQFTCAGNNAAEQDGQHWSTTMRHETRRPQRLSFHRFTSLVFSTKMSANCF